MELRQLRQDQNKLWADMKALNDLAKNEKRTLTTDENQTWEKMHADLDALDKEIQRQEAFNETAKRMAVKAEAVTDREPEQKEARSRDQVFEQYVKRGLSELKPEERSVLEKRGTATQITTTDSLGGYLVPDQWSASIMETMKWYANVLDIANVQTTAKGGTFRIPTQDDTSTLAAIIGQGVADTVSDFTFGETTIDEFTYTSKLIKASWEQLNDSAYDLEGYIQKQIGQRIGRKWEVDLTTGAGTTEPYGFITGASSGKVAASTTAITSDEILDLIFSLDKSYRDNANSVLVMHDSTLKELRKLTVGSSDDRPIWQPSLRDGAPATLHGKRYIINNAMAELSDGVSSKVMAYGDFDYFIVRMVKGIEMVRLTERFADSRAVGYFAWARMGARVINSSAIKYLALAAS